MKKLLVVSAIAALGLTSVAFAGGLPEEMPAAPAAIASSDIGIYLGLQGGWERTNYKDLDTISNMLAQANVDIAKDNGAVGRAFLGYDINRYFAVEAGYSYFFNKVTFNNEDNIKTQAADLYFKGKLPVVDNFDLYAKLGAGWLFAKGDDVNRDNINVAFGAGADYYITPNVIANVEWTRIAGYSKFGKDYIPNTDAFMVGLRYKFDL